MTDTTNEIKKHAEIFVKSIVNDALKKEQKLNIKTNRQMKFKPIENTPFTLIEDEENGVIFTGCGKYRVSHIAPATEENRKALIEDCQRPTWDNLVAVFKCMFEKELETNKTK